VRQLRAKDVHRLLLEAQPVVLRPRRPLDQLDDELDLLPVAHRRHAEEVLDVEDSEAADLHVVLEHLVPVAIHVALPPEQIDDVVRHQAVPTHHQIEGDLALADPRLAQQQHADAEHVDQHAVKVPRRGEGLFEERLHL
jgi:hypothetical protein